MNTKITEAGTIPEDWNAVKIKFIADVKTGPFGSALHAKDYVLEGTPIITVEHLGEHGITRQNLPQVSDEDTKRLKSYILKAGDIAFSRVGSVDRNAYVTLSEDGWLFSGRILRLRPVSTDVDSRYLGYYFKLDETKNRIRNVAVGQTMASLNTKIMRDFSVALPPTIDEQTAIATALSDMDTLIDNLRRLIDKKKNIRQGAMQELLTGKRRLPGFEGEWEYFRLGDDCKFIGGGTPSTKIASHWNGNIPWVSSSDLTENDIFKLNETRFITDEAVSDSATQICPPNSILIVTRVGIGKVALCNHKICTSQDFTNLYTERHNILFLAYRLLPIMRELAARAQGTSIKGITAEDVKSIRLLMPEINEQAAIAKVLTDTDEEIRSLESKLKKYERIKSGMMEKLLTGQIRLV